MSQIPPEFVEAARQAFLKAKHVQQLAREIEQSGAGEEAIDAVLRELNVQHVKLGQVEMRGMLKSAEAAMDSEQLYVKVPPMNLVGLLVALHGEIHASKQVCIFGECPKGMQH